MAVRPQHMHDGGIVERRLRPIYDWLDNGNNKKALQEAEKVLKKSPTLQAARALKALALYRLGKNDQAQALLDELTNEKLCDDTTLQAMTISYRESQQLHKVCALYETAVKADPANEELHSHLFMSYVRVADYRSQQRAAMALYKQAPKNPYYFWAVMSIVLQAKTAEDATKRGILLALAQRMVDNFIADNKMEAEQEARLYIMILELQEKWEDILKFIETPLYSQLVPGSTAQASIPYLKKLGQWRRLNLLCKELLWDNQDRWDYYLPYFDSVFQLMKESDGSNEGTADDTAEKCHEFICQLVESMSSGRTLRGPYLARLELWKRLAVDGDPTSLLGSGVALCVQYLRVFANKPCAVPDLRPYMSMIPQKEREEHSRDFLTCLGFDENSEPDNTDDIQRHISCLAAWRIAAPPLAGDACAALARTLRAHYLRCLTRGLVTATLTEFCAADGYGVLAAHHYYFAATRQKSSAPVIEAVSLLELVLHHSPSNFHAKLLLVTLYHFLGNALAADSIYQKLEIKHIQLVSLGWLHAARLAPAGAASRALQLLTDTKAFHTHHGKDSVEHLTYAYKYGTFEKLVELRAWGARLEQCAWGAAAARRRALLALAAGPPAPLHAPPRLPARPTDNRDLDAIVSFEPPEAQDPELKARTFDQELAYLRLCDGLVSCIALCIELSCIRDVAERKPQCAELRSCLEAWGRAMAQCRTQYDVRERCCISKPLPSRIIAFVTSPVPYRELYCSLLRLVCALAGGPAHAPAELAAGLLDAAPQQLRLELDAGKEQDGVWHLRDMLESVSNYLEVSDLCRPAHAPAELAAGLLDAAPQQLRLELDAGKEQDRVWHLRDMLESASNYLEFIGIATFLLGVCNEMVAPANTKKPKKKTSQSPDELKTTELLNRLNESVQNSITFLEEVFDDLPQYELSTLEEEFSKLNIDDKYQSPVESKLKNGRQDMINDVKNILKKKHKYLKSLIQ